MTNPNTPVSTKPAPLQGLAAYLRAEAGGTFQGSPNWETLLQWANEVDTAALARPLEVAEQSFEGFLCRAWGETDLPCAEVVRDWDGVSRFMVREWLGGEDAADADGTPTLQRVMYELKNREWGEDGNWVARFEIGGVSVEPVYSFAASRAPVAVGVEPECENCNQLARALREATEPPIFMGEPVGRHALAQQELSAVAFICFLIDNHEGEVVAEESLQQWLGEVLKNPRYSGATPSPGAGGSVGAEPTAYIWRCVESGLLRVFETQYDADQFYMQNGNRLLSPQFLLCYDPALAMPAPSVPLGGGEVAEWQARVGTGAWRRIDPPRGETIEERVKYLRDRAHTGGAAMYEVRALYAHPAKGGELVGEIDNKGVIWINTTPLRLPIGTRLYAGAPIIQAQDAAPVEPKQASPWSEKDLDELITQRDHREEIIDALCDAVLGEDRDEWSSAYYFEDAVTEVQERMGELEARAGCRADQKVVPVPAGVQGDAARLTPDEIEVIMQALGEHDGSDFEPECPNCTAYRKLAAIAQSTKGA